MHWKLCRRGGFLHGVARRVVYNLSNLNPPGGSSTASRSGIEDMDVSFLLSGLIQVDQKAWGKALTDLHIKMNECKRNNSVSVVANFFSDVLCRG